ncbi:polysaccharide pyruvyl transferase family protein [Krasilnikoviella flava]|uniref:Polysaccharide pyruvyl transferase family protein WcaK n=1 Tax=Krasilnikoviella flava TaxID=526729 RepID=A0A1T5IAI2_9MICO|nr:polysaccharide pyruvyl transferase family protein [Krasilnikoviella flava]SKC36179.1 Polysaccharide pyruvyl transferase family protein WcaK [Krasilnikoviella flava]
MTTPATPAAPARLFSWQYYTHNNYGDALLAEAVRYLFHSFGGQRYFRVEDGADSRYPVGPRLVDKANSFDAGLIAGGGVIIPRNHDLSGWAFRSSVAQARRMRRTIVFAVGFNLYRNHRGLAPKFKEHFEAVIEGSPFVGMRNHGSIERLKEVVDPRFHDRIVFQPCPTTFLRHLVDGAGSPDAVPGRSRRVTLQITRSPSEKDDRVADQVLQACRSLRAAGYEIELASFFAKFDTPVVDHLRAHGFDDFTFVEMNTQGRDMLSGPRYFSQVPIVVSTRGHGAMVPFGAGSLVVPIDNSPKMVYFAREVGIEDLLIDVDDPDLGARIVAHVERCHDDYDAMQDRARKERERLYEVSLENLSRIYRSLTGQAPSERECLPLGDLEVWLSSRLHAKTMAFEGKTRGEAAQAAAKPAAPTTSAPAPAPDRADVAREWLREQREELYAQGDTARATQVRRALEVVTDPDAPTTTVGRGARYVRRRLRPGGERR